MRKFDKYKHQLAINGSERFREGNEYKALTTKGLCVNIKYVGKNTFSFNNKLYKAKINTCNTPREECALMQGFEPVFSRGF